MEIEKKFKQNYDYIKYTFLPFYYCGMNFKDQDIVDLVNSKAKKMNTKQLLDGKLDSELIEYYDAKLGFTDDNEPVARKVVVYIRDKFFPEKMPFLNGVMSNKDKTKMVLYIWDQYLKNKFDTSEILNGNVNLDIFINQYIQVRHPDVIKKAEKLETEIEMEVWIKSNIRFNYSHETLKYIAKKMADIFKKGFNYNWIYIADAYADASAEMLSEFNKHIVQTIANKVDVFPFVNQKKICADLAAYYLLTLKVNIRDIFDGKYDDEIVKYVERVIAKRQNEKHDSVLYIIKYIKEMMEQDSVNLTDAEIMGWATYIDNNLHQRGIRSKEICEKRHDGEIKGLYDSLVMRYGSIKYPDEPSKVDDASKVEHKPTKRQVPKSIMALILLGSLTAAGGLYCVGNAVYNFADEMITDVKYSSTTRDLKSSVDSFSYSAIHTSTTDAYKPTMRNTLDFYDNVKHLNDDNYNYLGFFRAYEHVMDHKLQIMDKMLYQARDLAIAEGYDDSFISDLNCSCFLDFVCDRLYEMGFTEITNSKYQEALAAYENAMGKGEEPFKLLSDEHQAIIREIMAEYKNLSRKSYVSLGDLLEDALKAALSVGTGGKHI